MFLSPISFGLLFLLLSNDVNAGAAHKKSVLNVAIIGAGVSGLCSARHAIAQAFNVIIFEQTEQIGGIWFYTDKVGKDQYGVDIHTSMYQGLRTNAPYQVMEYPNFHYPNGTISYPPQSDVLNYLNSFADHFDLKKHIRFSHLVIRVRPIKDTKWEIIVIHAPTNKYETHVYDVVFVCNGHYSLPLIPEIRGEFQGQMIHSHDFRTAHTFSNKSVLVIGAGVSGRDLVHHLSQTARHVTFSQHKIPNETEEARQRRQRLYSPKVTLKDNVKCFTSNGAEFIDDSREAFDTVIYATGYNYTFPFLNVDSGIHVDSNFVQPLYKHIFNIEHPTMVFFGITSGIATTHMLDLQVRFALTYISGVKLLPSKAEMLKDMQIQTQIHLNQGYRKHRAHFFLTHEKEYLNQLSEIGGLAEIPNVLLDIGLDSIRSSREEPSEFRKYKYIIVDDNTFSKVKYEE